MSKIKQMQFQKKVGWLFGVLVLLLLMITYSGWSDYKKAQNLAQAQTQNLALLLQQKIQSDFERIDEVLAVSQSYVKESSSKCDITQKLQTLVQQFDGVEVLNYFDAQGALQCSSLESVGEVNIVDRPHFLVLKNNPDIHKSFSNVITARTSGENSVAQLRAVYSDGGEFMGIISALVRLDRFADAIASIDVGQSGVSLLRRSDNSHLIVREPIYNKNDFNHPLVAHNPIRQMIDAGVKSATLSYTATTDGVQRLGSFKVLDGYPFYVQVAFSKDEYLAPWKVHMAILTAIVLVLSAFFVVIVRKLAYGYNIEMQTAEKLAKNNDNLSTVLNNTQDVIYSIALPEYRLLFVSPSIENIYGYTHKEFDEDKDLWFKVIEPKDRKVAENAQKELFERGASEATYQIIQKDGNKIWISNKNRLSYDDEGNPMRIDGSVRDVGKMKRLEFELTKEKMMLQSVFDVLPVGITVTDEAGNIIDCNKESQKILGITKQQHLQRNYAGGEWQIIRSDHTPMPPEEFASVKALRQKKAFYDEEMGIVRSDGVAWILVSAMPIEAKGYGVAIAYIDVTEQKLINEKIEKLNQSLGQKVFEQTKELRTQLEQLQHKDKMLQEQAKLAAMGEMMSAIAHQWRQPLNALSINIQNLDDDYEDGLIDEVFLEKFIDKQTQMIGFMSKTIDDFRNFFKTDKQKTSFSVKSIVKNVYKLLQAQMKNHNIEVLIEGDDFSIDGYPSEMQQVFLNLFSNAKDAILKNATSGTISIGLESKNKTLLFCDTGGGAKSELLDKIFDPYFTTKDPDKGTGIGLHISRTIVVSHMGGQMRAYNSQNGLCMEIQFKS